MGWIRGELGNDSRDGVGCGDLGRGERKNCSQDLIDERRINKINPHREKVSEDLSNSEVQRHPTNSCYIH